MAYAVKEIFYTLQGEGAQAGMAAVFCRFAGCNLWSGREQDRTGAICQFCDTDFVGVDGSDGGKYADAETLAQRIAQFWPVGFEAQRLVVCTGGEPLLQLDAELVAALHAQGFRIAIETNGTLPVPDGVDWICVSPKSGAELVVKQGHELKVVIPQPGQDWAQLENLAFQHRFVQPMDGPLQKDNIRVAIAFCQQRPLWRLSLQTHKQLGIR